MTPLNAVGVAIAAALLLGAFVLGWRRPVAALVLLLALLPIHSLVIVLAREWIGQPPGLTVVGLWKEATVAGLVVPILPGLLDGAIAGLRPLGVAVRSRAGLRAWVSEAWRDRDVDLTPWLVVAFLVYLTLEVPVSILRGNPTSGVILDWRGLAVPFLALLAVRVRGITIDVAVPAVRAIVLVGGLVAAYAYVQVFVLGFRFLNTFYRDPGEPLATAYRVGVSAVKVPRAIGGHVAPNEFGLFLVIVAFGYLVVLLRRPASAAMRRVQVVAGYAMLLALVITYSRSAWVGAVTALVVLAIAWVRYPGTWRSIRRRSREVLAGGVVTIAILVAVAVASGAFAVAEATVGGRDPSASGRATSISRGVGAALRNPLGLGLGAAGPRAYAIDPSAVRTESWYLVTAVELGWVGGGLFGLTLLSVTRDLVRGWRRKIEGAVPTMAAWAGALAGAFAIPALFDLPAAIPLLVLVGIAEATIAERIVAADVRSERLPDDRPGEAPEPA